MICLLVCGISFGQGAYAQGIPESLSRDPQRVGIPTRQASIGWLDRLAWLVGGDGRPDGLLKTCSGPHAGIIFPKQSVAKMFVFLRFCRIRFVVQLFS